MYTKILFVVIIFILGAFFYLHTQNPGVVAFVVTKDHTYTLPVTLLVFAGFIAGAMLAVVNSLLVDAKRAIREMRGRRERKLVAEAENNYRKGFDALVKGDIAGARPLIEKAIKAKPSDTEMVISLADTYIRENRPREALKILENGSLNNPESTQLLIAISKCSEDSGDAFRAGRALEGALKLDPKNPYALRKLRDLRIKDGRWADAAALERTVLEAERDDNLRKKEKRLLTGILFESAVNYLNEGNLNEAVKKVKEVLKSDDTFMPAHILLGDVLYRQGNTDNAIKVWEKAHHRYSNAVPLLLKLEDIYIKESAPDKILEKYKREISARPNDVNLRLLLARLYLRLEMVDNAIEELERLHYEGEDTVYPQILLGEAYLRRKQSSKAAHLFQRALGLDKEFLPPFVCAVCGHNAKAWSPRCPSCGDWNTVEMNPLPASRTNPAVSGYRR